MKYVQNPEKFEAIQFVSGKENVIDMLKEIHEISGHKLRIQWVDSFPATMTSYEGEHFLVSHRDNPDAEPQVAYPTNYIVFNLTDKTTQLLTDEDFERMFSPEEETVAQINYDEIASETAEGSSEFHIEPPGDILKQAFGMFVNPSDTKDDSPKAPKYVAEVEAIQFMGGEKNLDFIGRWVFAGGGQVELHAQSENNTEHLRMTNTDGETSYTIAPGDWILKDALGFAPCHEEDFPKLFKEHREKVDENTLFKVKDALDTLTVRQPYMNEAKVKTGVTSETIIQILLNAGILFRERV